ncbi:CRISPR-associated endoribonuclease Cas6 [Candidatus Poribacteria bacterium]|nr:CRISPR-associated endoribonuclease Cas6 [Candidatus Poribacteria bacterium]
MRIEISLDSEGEIRLPIHYNSVIQGMIYNNISPELARYLHDTGFTYGKRSFKMFTFSNINGRYRLTNSDIIFSPPIKLVISSPMDDFIQQLGYFMMVRDDLNLGVNPVRVSSFDVPEETEPNESEVIGMLSPVTVYSTLKTGEGKNKTYYYSPFEDEFSQLIENNLKKKYAVITGTEPDESYTLTINPLKVDKRSEKILKYKGTVIKAWRGVYSLQGNPALIKVGHEAGIGSKNSQGFGCFKFLKRDNADD